jgi:hypothetical protein
MVTLKTSATRLKPFGLTITEPELTLILLANIHQAKDHEWGQEFRTAMSANHKAYKYGCIHTTNSLVDILNKLAGADKLQAMKLAPAPGRGNASLVANNRSTLKRAQADWAFR